MFGIFISLSVQRFEYICQYSGGQSFEEQVSGFSVSLGVSGLSCILFKVRYILGDVGPLHVAFVKPHSCSLLFIEVLELSFKLTEELSPYSMIEKF